MTFMFANKPKSTKAKSFIKWSIVILLIMVVCWIIYRKLNTKEVQPSYITATVQMGDIENNVMASGKVKALNTVNVGAQVSGEVVKLYVKVGDEVKKGDLIAQIDQVTQQNNVTNQQASLTQSHASLQSAQADLKSREAVLRSAQADLKSREAELGQAQVEFERLGQLIDIQAISRQEYEVAKTNVDTAIARVNNAKAAIDNAKAAIDNAQSNIVNNQAMLQKSQTDLDTAKQNLAYTTIRAPIDGTVVSVTTEQGTTVNANQSAPTIVTLADLSTVRINAQISEADVINVKAGMPAYFNTIGAPDKKYDATLTAIEPAPEQLSTNSATDAAVYYIGYIEVPNLQRLFRIDMTAQVFIVTDQAKQVLLVPSAAIRKGLTNPSKGSQSHKAPNTHQQPSEVAGSQNYYVRVLGEDGLVEERAVTVGINNRVNAQILSGLKVGETVIIGESRANFGHAPNRRMFP